MIGNGQNERDFPKSQINLQVNQTIFFGGKSRKRNSKILRKHSGYFRASLR
jgi:hypothetical protein